MIIWINGTFGVGKSTVAQALKKIMNDSFELIDSDEEYIKMIRKDENLAFGGAFPQNNENFIKIFRKLIQDKINNKKNLIVDMAITEKKSKDELINYFKNKNDKFFHFVCTADDENIKNRIMSDKNRDKSNAIYYVNINKKFLDKNFKNAIWIDTNNKNPEDIASEIYTIIKKH